MASDIHVLRGRFLRVLLLSCFWASSGSVVDAIASAELHTTASYRYGKFEARIRFAGGDGVISSFFLWKRESHQTDTPWSELDFEKVGLSVGGDCKLELNAITGNPGPVNSVTTASVSFDICATFHIYAFEWAPTYIAWSVDGNEIRRATGSLVQSFVNNASAGVQLRFNVWPGDASFGGTFNARDLPVYQYVDWVRYSSHSGGSFVEQWFESFDGGGVPADWQVGSWGSPKGLSTHRAPNVFGFEGCAILALTADSVTPTSSSAVGCAIITTTITDTTTVNNHDHVSGTVSASMDASPTTVRFLLLTLDLLCCCLHRK